MDFTGHIVGLAKDFASSRWHLTIEMDKDSALEMIQDFGQDTKLAIRIWKWRKKRSLDANAYLWKLCTEIASHKDIRSSKEEVYLEKLFAHPVFEMIDGHCVIGTFKQDVNVNQLAIEDSNVHHYWMPVPDSLKKDPEWGWYTQDYMMVRGSSLFDAGEMKLLLDDVIEEAKSLGISTETDIEKQKLIDRWAREYAKAHK